MTAFENRTVSSDRDPNVPFPKQMLHIEVEAFADDLEDEPPPLAKVDEVAERLADHANSIAEPQQLFLAGPNQREWTDHRLSRSDFPGAVELFDFPPLRRRERVENCLRHVCPGDRPIEIGKDGPLVLHRTTALGVSRGFTSLLARTRGRHVARSLGARSGSPCYVASSARPSGRVPA